INNPVTVIQGNLDVARQILGADAAPVKTEFDLIDAQVYRITSIVAKLLQFARPGEFSGSANQLSPCEVVADCLVLTGHQLRQARVEVVREDSGARRVLMERTELQQVMINLIVNAVHAMPEGGTLRISCHDADEEDHAGVAISVADTGRGIASDVVGRIFDPFFTTKRAEGTGLGLSISRMLVTRIGGSIRVDSVEGQGATFTVWLPAAM
ncbi:MAG: HAMP domain-containing histidine kinase, partial [Paracoccaceae bacterium]|nr:HAMP domain-containing histidine kinase [Paracoccaceae bacterium]